MRTCTRLVAQVSVLTNGSADAVAKPVLAAGGALQLVKGHVLDINMVQVRCFWPARAPKKNTDRHQQQGGVGVCGAVVGNAERQLLLCLVLVVGAGNASPS